jgi:predicted small lipoprotein YifL
LKYRATGRGARVRVGRAARLGALLAAFGAFAALGGCGQRGPLTLPDSARPIEPLDPAAQPSPEPGASAPNGVAQPAPGAATGTTPPARREPDPEDDETENEAGQPRE